MNENTLNFDRRLDVPYVDQWFGQWFIEPQRGQSLFSVVKQLNLSVHLQSRQQAAESSEAKAGQQQQPNSVPIDYEAPPPTRRAYGYRIIDGVAILEISGTLMKHEASMTESTSTTMMRRSVRKLMSDDQAKAVIFQADSPGGTVAGIYELADDIAALAKIKPVHGYGANISASACYLLLSQMRSISASASTLVGSLGTFGVVYDMSKMAENDGIKVHLLKGRVRGREALMKGAGTPGTEISAEQLARMQEGVDDLNEQFIQAVLRGPRKPKQKDVEDWFADAGVWVAGKSLAMGLIDRVESFDDMLARISSDPSGKGSKSKSRDTVPSDSGKDDSTDEPSAGRRSAGDDTSNTATAAADVPPAGSEAGISEEIHMDPKTQSGAAAPAAPSAAPATSEPKAASMAELIAACAGAPDSFLVEQAKVGSTVQQAKDNFIGFQAGQIRARDEELTKIKSAQPVAAVAAEDKPAEKKPGQKALNVNAAEQQAAAADGDAVAKFIDRRDALCKEKGITRAQAIMKIAADDPALHQAFIESANASRAK